MANARPADPFPQPGRPAAAVPVQTPMQPSGRILTEDDVVELQGRRGGGVLPWSLFAISAGALAFVWFGVHVPLSAEHRGSTEQLEARAAETEAAKTELAAAQTQLEELQGKGATFDQLATKAKELETERDQLAAAVSAKEAELDAAQKKLEGSLADEIKGGDVSIRKHGGELVVGVADRVLFERGDAALNKRGERVMKRVADTIKANAEHVFQVAGHTDDDPVTGALAARFPTNWELSTARATTVVRFLIEQGGVEGRQLVAAGFADQRPAASNRSSKGKHKNRRIEITMLMLAPPKAK